MVENVCVKLAFITVLIFMFRFEIFPNLASTFDGKVSSLVESKIMFSYFACLRISM